MHSSRRLLVLLTIAAAGVAGWGAVQVFAAGHDGGKPSPVTNAGSAPVALAGSRVSLALLTTFVSESNDSEAVPAGFQSIDAPTAFTCVAPGHLHGGTCTIEADQNVQVIGSTPNNAFAICTQVDGVFVGQPVCPFIGTVPNGSYGTGSFMQTGAGISPGPHTVQTFLFTTNGAVRSIYTLVYRLYAG